MIDLFTKQEKVFISFLLFGILVGAGIELYRSHFSTVSKATQIEEIDDFEKQIQEKAALIDSLLVERKLYSENGIFSSTNSSKTLSTVSEIGGKSNQKNLLIEINTATVDELMRLPQIGPVIANRIIEYRNIHGAFKNIEALINVKGIGKKKLNIIKSYIYIKQK
ncbi:MAG: helix-hairpin-helix domain-containing protein [bacterium]|nr:MAG: helix-hairpin-helix domain-containing protein [bacterium]